MSLKRTNPWYVLMTLYGEPKNKRAGHKVQEKNRKVWNAWMCQGLSDQQLVQLHQKILHNHPDTPITLGELGGWDDMADEVHELHRQSMRDSSAFISGDFDYPGIPNPKSDVEVTNAAVHGLLLGISGFYFGTKLKLTGLRERLSINAVGAYFAKDVDLNQSSFGELFFSNCYFEGNSSFAHSTFESRARFDNLTFQKNVSFELSTFEQLCWFSQTSFDHNAQFLGGVFKGRAIFENSAFHQGAMFQNSEFQSRVGFQGCQFGDECRENPLYLDLRNASFKKPVTFRESRFLNRYPLLDGAELPAEMAFTMGDENWPERVDGRSSNDLSSWIEDKSEVEKATTSCSMLRQAFAKQGFPEEEHFFFRREMAFTAQIGPIWQRLPYLIYGALSDYGYSIEKPIKLLAYLWAFCMGIYVSALWCDLSSVLQGIKSILTGAAFSFANIFKFFGLQGTYFGDILRDAHWVIQVLSATQTVFGFVLLFFLGLGLRQRFRLR